MERSFILCEQPRSRSQRPMEMGCAYNEAQVRGTLFKKWIRLAQSQLEWTQVLQTVLSAPIWWPRSSPFFLLLHSAGISFDPPRDTKMVSFGEWRKQALNKINWWFLGTCSASFTKNRPWQRHSSGLNSCLLPWPSLGPCCPVNRFKWALVFPLTARICLLIQAGPWLTDLRHGRGLRNSKPIGNNRRYLGGEYWWEMQ